MNTEDEIAIAFQTNDMVLEGYGTRALTEPSTVISELTVVIFNNDGGYQYSQSYLPADFIDATGGSGKAVKISRRDATAGNWYLVANAKSLIESWIDETDSKDESKFKRLVIDRSKLIGTGVSSAIMVGKRTGVSLPAPGTPTMQAFILDRRFAKIEFKVPDTLKDKFLVTGVSLYKETDGVNLDGTPIAKAEKDGVYVSSPLAATTNTISHLKAGDLLEFFTLPVSNKMKEEDGNDYPEARLLIKGRFRTGTTDTGEAIYGDNDCFYGFLFPSSIEANHKYVLTLSDVMTEGKTNEEAALEEPIGAVVKYEDKVAEMRNIVTDGERALALPDTLKLNSNAATKSINVRWRGTADDILSINTDNLPSWLTIALGSKTADTANTTAEETGKGYQRFTTPLNIQIGDNKGTEREYSFKVMVTDKSNETKVETTYVICQDAPLNVNLYDDLAIKLTIKRSGATDIVISDYLAFIGNNPSGTGDKLLGVGHEANGGRVRNAGLHIPMSNGGVTYEYEITPKSGNWTIETPSGVTKTDITGGWKLTFTDTANPLDASSAYSYVVADNGIMLKSGNKELGVDLYHTGFFHKYDNKWYYYEVFSAGSQRWLDRNLCATASGMAQLTSSYVGGTEWPMDQNSAGGRYNYATVKPDNSGNYPAIVPAGWRVPTQGDFEVLTNRSEFTSERVMFGSTTLFLPSYRFQNKTIRPDGSMRDSYQYAYFPHNRYEGNSGVTGDSGAGYYWTTTNTDNEQFYRIMKFDGQNVITENKDVNYKMSVRCVSGAEVNETYKYSCMVKGYTNVFLYHQGADGVKTYLNTWPGTQVATTALANKRFNQFELETYSNYPENEIFVIFTNVTSTGITANVTTEKARAREGIPFKADKGYDYNADKLVYPETGTSIVISGNWTEAPEVPEDEILYIIRGNNIWGSGWQNKDMTKDPTNPKIWKLDNVDVNACTEFGIQEWNVTQTNENNWYNGDGSVNITDSGEWTLKTGGTQLSIAAGNYSFEFNTETHVLKVTKNSGGIQNNNIRIYWIDSDEKGRTHLNYQLNGTWTMKRYDGTEKVSYPSFTANVDYKYADIQVPLSTSITSLIIELCKDGNSEWYKPWGDNNKSGDLIEVSDKPYKYYLKCY